MRRRESVEKHYHTLIHTVHVYTYILYCLILQVQMFTFNCNCNYLKLMYNVCECMWTTKDKYINVYSIQCVQYMRY